MQFLIDTLMNSDGDICLVPTGPLTNIAMALRTEPRIAKKIRRISLMGGAVNVGNTTPAAEFNIYADPEAAHGLRKLAETGRQNLCLIAMLTGIIGKMDNVGIGQNIVEYQFFFLQFHLYADQFIDIIIGHIEPFGVRIQRNMAVSSVVCASRYVESNPAATYGETTGIFREHISVAFQCTA